MSRLAVCRREEMRKVRDRSSQDLRAYELGGQEFNAAADCIDGCIQRLDELLSHPSIVLAERRFSLSYEARKTLAALRIELHGSSR